MRLSFCAELVDYLRSLCGHKMDQPQSSSVAKNPEATKQPTGEEPRNARILAAMLQSMGVEACEPRVIHQLLEFFHRMKSSSFEIFFLKSLLKSLSLLH